MWLDGRDWGSVGWNGGGVGVWICGFGWRARVGLRALLDGRDWGPVGWNGGGVGVWICGFGWGARVGLRAWLDDGGGWT